MKKDKQNKKNRKKRTGNTMLFFSVTFATRRKKRSGHNKVCCLSGYRRQDRTWREGWSWNLPQCARIFWRLERRRKSKWVEPLTAGGERGGGAPSCKKTLYQVPKAPNRSWVCSLRAGWVFFMHICSYWTSLVRWFRPPFPFSFLFFLCFFFLFFSIFFPFLILLPFLSPFFVPYILSAERTLSEDGCSRAYRIIPLLHHFHQLFFCVCGYHFHQLETIRFNLDGTTADLTCQNQTV